MTNFLTVETEATEINTSIVFDRHEQAGIGSDNRSSHILEYSNLAFGMQMIIPKPIGPNPFWWPIRNTVRRHKRMIAKLHNWPLKDACTHKLSLQLMKAPILGELVTNRGKAEGQRCDPPYLRDQNLLVIVVFVPMLFPLIFV